MVEVTARREDAEKVDNPSLSACFCGGVGVECVCELLLARYYCYE